MTAVLVVLAVFVLAAMLDEIKATSRNPRTGGTRSPARRTEPKVKER